TRSTLLLWLAAPPRRPRFRSPRGGHASGSVSPGPCVVGMGSLSAGTGATHEPPDGRCTDSLGRRYRRLIAALARMIHRGRWSGFIATPAPILRAHGRAHHPL